MASFYICAVVIAMFASTLALPTQVQEPANEGAFWKSTLMDGTFEELRSECAQKDEVACMKYKVLSFVDQFFQKDSFKVTERLAVVKNSFAEDTAAEARSAGGDFLDRVENYVQSHDVTLALPGSTITVSPRNLDEDEINVSFDFSGESRGAEEARKSKLKRILIPIMIFVLLKAMTLIPLFIGILGLKAWNALQLSFFSFVISVALAVFQLCKKIATDGAHPIISAHNPWEAAAHYAARSLGDSDPQTLAYRAHQD